MKITDLPKLFLFPLSNFIIFQNYSSFKYIEPRYIDMIDDSMKTNKFIGMIQPKNINDENNNPKLYDVAVLVK